MVGGIQISRGGGVFSQGGIGITSYRCGVVDWVYSKIDNLRSSVTLIVGDGNGEGIRAKVIGRGRISPVSIDKINSRNPVGWIKRYGKIGTIG